MALAIGKYIEYALNNSADVTDMVGTRIYPIIAPLDGASEMPYIVFASNGVSETRSKDCVESDTNTEELMLFALDLATLEELATKVRSAMESAWKSWNEQEAPSFLIAWQDMAAGQEDYDLAHDGYFVTITYTIETE